MIDANNGLAQSGDLVDARSNHCIEMSGRTEGSAKGGGGRVAVKNLSSAADVLGVPTSELVAASDRAQETTSALDIVGTRGAAGSTEAAKGSIH